jgi:hypothetical protein
MELAVAGFYLATFRRSGTRLNGCQRQVMFDRPLAALGIAHVDRIIA